MLVDGSTVAFFVTANVLAVGKAVVLISALLVCPLGTRVLVSFVVDPIPAIGLGRNPLTVSDPRFISIEFVFTEDAKQVKYSDVLVVGAIP